MLNIDEITNFKLHENKLSKNITIASCTVLALLGLQGCDIEISVQKDSTPLSKNTVATLSCDTQKNLKFNEENSNITIKGNCQSIQIVGENNHFIIDSTQSIQLAGKKNTLHIKQGKSIQIAGYANKMQLGTSKDIAVAGINNSIQAKSANSIKSAGFFNKVYVAKVNTLQMVGFASKLEYQQGLDQIQTVSFKQEGYFNKISQVSP